MKIDIKMGVVLFDDEGGRRQGNCIISIIDGDNIHTLEAELTGSDKEKSEQLTACVNLLIRQAAE